MIFEILTKEEPYLMVIKSAHNINKTIKLLIDVHGVVPISFLELDIETVEENDIDIKIVTSQND